ncbi:hypothetical protein MATL_G00176730 [Megalops atlanticus]|uniref:Uncharacterized protein n=1 Tax=Megalops atlanticus TaxID=7932 RepID=A0A9D3T0A7_MEGAT|nr:hypothetical protein MATL_G00176730 [Megalops atlanticus]
MLTTPAAITGPRGNVEKVSSVFNNGHPTSFHSVKLSLESGYDLKGKKRRWTGFGNALAHQATCSIRGGMRA